MTKTPWPNISPKLVTVSMTARRRSSRSSHSQRNAEPIVKNDYVPMPANVVNDIEQYWKSEIKDATGKPLFAMTN